MKAVMSIYKCDNETIKRLPGKPIKIIVDVDKLVYEEVKNRGITAWDTEYEFVSEWEY